jgi:hypothetical protein
MERRPNLALVCTWLVATCSCGKKDVPAGPNGAGAAAPTPSTAVAPVEQALALLAQFEGEIDLTMTNPEQKPPSIEPIALLIKSGKVRFDVPAKLGAGTPLGSGSYVILDSAAKKLEIVADAQKQVYVIDLNTSGEKLKALGGARPGASSHDAPKTTITKTGKVDTVAGRKCENWDIVGDHRQGTVCMTEEGTSWFQIPLSGLPAEHAWAAELVDGKHFPLRFVGYGKDGATESRRVEVTKIDKKSVPASDFEYPPTYTASDLGQMFAGLAGMQGGMPRMPMGAGGFPAGMPMGTGGLPAGMPMPPPRHHP